MSRTDAIIAEMQKQVWVMEPRHLTALFTNLIEFEIKVPAEAKITEQKKLTITGDTAVIKVSGVLLKTIPYIYRYFGIEATSYIDIQDQLAEAVGNPAIKKILLEIDSPGGVVAGVMETGQAIAAAAMQKKVTAKIEDLGASGAYWLASQAAKISAGPNAEVGSIGVFTVYIDSTARAKELGMKVHVIRSGEHKGMGVPGAEITEAQVEAVQKVIDGMADNFIKAVSSGRKMGVEAVRELADGRTYLAADAKKNGLIDNIITANKTKQTKEKNMAEEIETKGTTATAAETGQTAGATIDAEAVRKEAEKAGQERLSALQGAFANEPQFVLEQYQKGATVEQAKTAYCDVLAERLEKAEKEKTQPQKGKAGTSSDGANPLEAGGEGGNSSHSFVETARQLAKDEKISMTDALKRTKKDNPQLFEEYMNSVKNGNNGGGFQNRK